MHSTQVRVRLSETDQNGVVYYSQYFIYFDVAKTDFLRHEGLEPMGLGGKGLRLLAAETRCTYHIPAKFEDTIDVDVWVEKLGNSSIVFDFEAKNGTSTIADGYLVNVLVGAAGKPVKLPERARQKLARHLKKGS
jgi:acyl-CoA thioester hydrolase